MTDLLNPGEPAIEFELHDIKGQLVRLSDLSRQAGGVGVSARLYVTVLPRAVGALAR